jgi:hypothetical protein
MAHVADLNGDQQKVTPRNQLNHCSFLDEKAMTSTTDFQPNYSWQSARAGHVLGRLVVVLPPLPKQSDSRLRSFQQFVPSALGCRSETSASMGKTSIAFTKATSFLCNAEWIDCLSNCWRGMRNQTINNSDIVRRRVAR